MPPPTQPRRRRTCKLLFAAAVSACLAACGGGEIGGTVSGLGTGLSVTLLNNGSDSLTVSRNGSFAFATCWTTAPATGDGADAAGGPEPAAWPTARARSTPKARRSTACVSPAAIRPACAARCPGCCRRAALTLGNDTHARWSRADGPFAFAEVLADGTAYRVRVQTQPAGQTCNVQNGSGSFFAARFADIIVTCN